MSPENWILYGFPSLAILMAVAGLLFARTSAARFDRRYGHAQSPGRARETGPLTLEITGLSPKAHAEIERILRRENESAAGQPAAPPRHAAE